MLIQVAIQHSHTRTEISNVEWIPTIFELLLLQHYTMEDSQSKERSFEVRLFGVVPFSQMASLKMARARFMLTCTP